MSKLESFNACSPLPHKEAFFPIKGVYFNAGVQHPISRASMAAAKRYLDYKSFQYDLDIDPLALRKNVVEKYAKLINADADEIAIIASTTVGENLIIAALDLVGKGARVVTDDLHYFGSYQIFGELKKQGVEITTIRNKSGTIDYEEYEAAITDETDLVCVSGVSTFNGHQHDLKRLSTLAHKHGALIYADVIHQVGATPLDVRDCDIDFCSAGSFKWLMADQGCGFLYVKRESLKKLKRPWYGKRQVRNLVTHVFPGDDITTDENIYEYELAENSEGYFSIWSEPRIVLAQLDQSLAYLNDVGVDRIVEYRLPIVDYLRDEIEALGFKCLTPPASITPLLSFECNDAKKRIKPIFEQADIKASLYKGHFRLAISVYNDLKDAQRVVDALKHLD